MTTCFQANTLFEFLTQILQPTAEHIVATAYTQVNNLLIPQSIEGVTCGYKTCLLHS